MKHQMLVLFLLSTIQWQTMNGQTVTPESLTLQTPATQSHSNLNQENSIANVVEEVITNDDFMAVDQNKPTTSSIIANDLGINIGVKSVVVIEKPPHGNVEILPDFSARYTPNRNYIGPDVFRYRVCNINNECGEGTVKISVIDVDYKPKGVTDSADVIYYSYNLLDVIKNDVDVFDDPQTITITKPSENSDSEITVDNLLAYHPHRNFWGLDSLTYQVCDKEGDCSSATIYIKVAEWTYNDIVIPNGMSPNGDGMNDFFEIQEFTHIDNKVNINIFNSWGDLVYKNEMYKNDWDGIANTGISKGKKVPIGTYYYLMMVEGSSKKLTGFIYIAY